jgi:hypothetical protein
MQVEDFRGAPEVPLVVFPADGALPPPPRLGEADRRRIGLALDALGGLRRMLQDSTRRDDPLAALTGAVAALRTVSAGLAPSLARPEPGIGDAAEPHDVYMGVRRGALRPGAMAAELAVIVHRAVADLALALVGVNDMLAETDAVAALLTRLAGGPGAPGAPPVPDGARPTPGARPAPGAPPVPGDSAGAARAVWAPSGDGLERWVLVHHLYGVFLLHCASFVAEATARLDDGDPDTAARALEDATVYLRGATAAMLHAGAVPAAYYGWVIRPTMRPPATPMHLGGSMNPENARLRAAMAGYLERSPEPFETLVRRQPRLALARDGLLAADLLDIERHVAVAAVLVGDERSLLQHERSPDNAVGILRRMRHERAVRYCPLMRWGDRAVLGPAPLEVGA